MGDKCTNKIKSASFPLRARLATRSRIHDVAGDR